MLFLDNVGQWAVPILVGGPFPWKVWIKHQAFAVKSFYLPLLQKKVHILQLILLKTAGKSEMLGITSMDPTFSNTYAPFTSTSSAKKKKTYGPLFLPLVLSADSFQKPNSDSCTPVTSTMNIYCKLVLQNVHINSYNDRNRAQQTLYWCEGSTTSYMSLIYTKWGIWSLQQKSQITELMKRK